MNKLIPGISVFALGICLGLSVTTAVATEYSGVDLIHTAAQGFSVTTTTSGSDVNYFVTNGDATLLVSRNQSVASPTVEIGSGGGNMTMSVRPRLQTNMDCQDYPNKVINLTTQECTDSCPAGKTCTCSICVVYGFSTTNGILTYGP